MMRDGADNTMVVCTMENFDPVGVHTGDSIVFAPTQTLTDVEHEMLRDASIEIVRVLGIEGGCNVQLALDPNSFQYYVIEVNPRVSRSSALASKATGYPIAKIAAKIAVGLTLDEIRNPVTGTTWSMFEPMLDYVVAKIPRWPFDKFARADRRLGTQMKATGEVMALGRTIEESLLKAVRSLEIGVDHLALREVADLPDDILEERLLHARDDRLFCLTEAIRRGRTVQELHEQTRIDVFFLDKIAHILDIEERLRACPEDPEALWIAKRNGFSDPAIARIWGKTLTRCGFIGSITGLCRCTRWSIPVPVSSNPQPHISTRPTKWRTSRKSRSVPAFSSWVLGRSVLARGSSSTTPPSTPSRPSSCRVRGHHHELESGNGVYRLLHLRQAVFRAVDL